jgi:hypothetical protein
MATVTSPTEMFRRELCISSRVEFQNSVQRVGPQVHQHEHDLDGNEAGGVDDHQQRELGQFYRLGTSRDTTRSVTAKAKTASENPSMRETSSPRQRKSSSPPCLRANPPRTTTRSPPLGLSRSPSGPDTMIKERPQDAQPRIFRDGRYAVGVHRGALKMPSSSRSQCRWRRSRGPARRDGLFRSLSRIRYPAARRKS